VITLDPNIQELLEEVVNAFPTGTIDEATKRDAKGRLKILLEEFKVPADEAVRTVISYIARQRQIPEEAVAPVHAPLTKVSDLKPETWASLKVRVVRLWETRSDVLAQTGLVGDETGLVRFVVWKSGDFSRLIEGRCYLLRNVFVQEYGGRLEVSINRRSRVEPIDEDIRPPRSEISGAIVAIHRSSGLVQRCPECRAVIKGFCPKHGRVNAVDDLCAKIVVDDGVKACTVLLNADAIKNLTGIGLNEARDIATRALDRSAVLRELTKRIFGRYVKLEVKGGGEGRPFVALAAEFDKVREMKHDPKESGVKGSDGIKGKNGAREPAKRVLAAEIYRSTHTVETSGSKVLLLSGELCGRVFFVGTLLEKTRTAEGVWKLRLADPTGVFYAFAGKYQPEVVETLHETDVPAIVAVVGKLKVLEGKRRITFLRPECLAVVDFRTRDLWLAEAASRTLERLNKMENSDNTMSRLAKEVYGTSTAYARKAAEIAMKASLPKTEK